MADTRLILHVKGTESETKEVPKEEVRTGLSQGKFSQTQLIWSPTQNAWKQAKEWPELSPEEQLILHVKGTEAETRQLPKPQVRVAISQGEITHSQLIWSPAESAWKQVRELPELLPSQKLAPAPSHLPTPTPAAAPEPMIPESPTGPVARAAVAAHKPQVRPPVALTGTPVASTPKVAATATPQVKVAATAVPQVKVAVAGTSAPQVKVATATPAGAPKVRVATATPKMAAAAVSYSARANAMGGSSGRSHEVKEDDEHHPMKWLCIGMGTLIFLILGLNFLLVNLPLRAKFVRTAYNNVSIYAHFGAFVQPNVIVIHIIPSPQVTGENLPELLVALAHSTPNSAVTRDSFSRVALTSGWTAQYSFSAESWKQVADLDQEPQADRKEALLRLLDDAGGQPVVESSTLSEEVQQAKRDEAWKKFVANFSTKS